MKFWHKASPAVRKAFIESMPDHTPLAELYRHYKQPAWCTYPGGLDGVMGCWSLTSDTITVNRAYCKSCDLYQKHSNRPIKMRR